MVVAILVLVAIVALFDLIALGWGVDSSDLSMDPRFPVLPSV